MHEIRLDALDDVDDALWPLLERHGERLVVCARAERQGGRFAGDERARGQLLLRAAEAGARYIDVEADVEDALLDALDRRRVVLSWHDFEGVPADIEDRTRRMVARDPAVVKVALAIDDAAELTSLLTLRPIIPQRAVLIGMGAAGLLSRTHYARLGSGWTYVAASPDRATAPGQLDIATALRHGLPESASAPLYALVGGPQVMGSPGPHVYNALFRELGIAGSYVPVVSRSLRRVLPLLEALDARGLSVTMPLKGEAFDRGNPDQEATQLGAVNSLKRTRNGWRGRNTDVTGVERPLREALTREGTVAKRALVLGAGGAASAAVAACEQIGLEVWVAARRLDRARSLSPRCVPWEERASAQTDVLINATPVVGNESPWPDEGPWPPLVFELALGAPSRLLERARAAGSHGLDALAMWLHQGAAQMSWFLDREITVADLERQLETHPQSGKEDA
jgi:3-dehydroquinate dehydratase/shikimate dehydrogenase